MDKSVNKIKKIVYIHVGIGKTATSAIQKIGKQVLTWYSEQDSSPVYCPVTDVHNNHHIWSTTFEPENCERRINECKDNFRRLPEKNYFISSEYLCWDGVDNIKSLCDFFKSCDYDIKIIFAIRNISDLIVSSYLQNLKSRNIKFSDVCNDFDLVDKISTWSSFADLRVIDFDFDRKNYIKRFYDYLGVSLDADIVKKEYNTTLNPNFVFFINDYDSQNRSNPEERRELINQLVKISAKYGVKNTSSLIEKIPNSIKEKWESDYLQLQKQYKFI